MGRRGPGHGAPYGQACLHCFKSKSKCVSQGDGAGCERCHRLNKECCPSDSFRRRHTRKSQNDAARFAQLEGRVDALVALLQSSPATVALRGGLGNGDDSHPTDLVEESTDGAYGDASSINLQTPFSQSPSQEANPSLASTATPGSPWEITSEEAEAHLALFRDKMLRFFTFLHLPPELSAQQLQQERPLLFRAILTVTAPSTQQRLLRGHELKELIAQAAIVESQAHMDLLLCVLTYVAWGYDQFFNKVASSSRLTQLAISLVGALNLHKSLPREGHSMPGEVHGVSMPESTNAETRQLLLEQARAVLGCFLLSSIVSSYFGDMDAMRWTSRMEGYLRDIDGNTPCSTDKTLALQVRLQRLAQRAVELRDQQETDLFQTSPLLASFYLRTLQGHLQEIRTLIPPRLEDEEVLMMHFYYAELSIYETIHTPGSDPTTSATRPSTMLPAMGLERQECHWRSLDAIKSWLDVFFSLSPATYVGLSFPLWAQVVRSIMVLYRLSVYAEAPLDRLSVRRTVDILPVLGHIADLMKRTCVEAGEQSPHDLFSKIAHIAARFQAWVALRLEPDPSLQPVSAAGPAFPASSDTASTWLGPGAFEGEMSVDETQMLMQFSDVGNDAWIGEFLGRF